MTILERKLFNTLNAIGLVVIVVYVTTPLFFSHLWPEERTFVLDTVATTSAAALYLLGFITKFKKGSALGWVSYAVFSFVFFYIGTINLSNPNLQSLCGIFGICLTLAALIHFQEYLDRVKMQHLEKQSTPATVPSQLA